MRRVTPDSVVRAAERGVVSGILAVFVVGIRRRDPGAVANAVLGLAAASLLGLVERRYAVELRPWQRLYAKVAMLAHAIGMLGPYDDVWWWDHITHTLSTTLLGGVVHVVARRRDRDPRSRVLAAVVVGGVIWELLEYAVHAATNRLDLDPVLIPYSARDTVLDLCFNLLGALLVLAFGDRLLRNVIRRAD